MRFAQDDRGRCVRFAQDDKEGVRAPVRMTVNGLCHFDRAPFTVISTEAKPSGEILPRKGRCALAVVV